MGAHDFWCPCYSSHFICWLDNYFRFVYSKLNIFKHLTQFLTVRLSHLCRIQWDYMKIPFFQYKSIPWHWWYIGHTVTTRYVNSTPTSEVTPVTIRYIHPPPPPHPPIHQISLFQTLTLRLQSQGHGWGQRSRSHSSPSIQPMHLLFVSHQSDQTFLRYVQ